jgi:hypothetical protein
MHFRRLASLFLGAWLCGSLFLIAVATRNFATADELLRSPGPEPAKQIQKIGHEPARMLLRHLASLQNLGLFENWERAQLALGCMLLLALFLGVESRPSTLVFALIMIAAVAVQHWLLTPQIIKLGRVIEFAPAGAPSTERAQFWNYHTAYSITELVKFGLGFLLALSLMKRRRRRIRQFDSKIDMVDHANHSHVDG